METEKSYIKKTRRTPLKNLLKFKDLPLHRKDNPYILKGYRIYNDYKNTLRSLFTFHNETINIWTHLLGGLLFVFIMAYTVSYSSKDSYVKEFFNLSTSRPSFKKLMKEISTKLESYYESSKPYLNVSSDIDIYFNSLRGKIDELCKNCLKAEFFENLRSLVDTEPIRQKIFNSFSNAMEMPYKYINLKGIEESQNFQIPSKIPIYMFIFCAMTCLFLSSAYHLFEHADEIFFQRLDYLGIFFLISGSTFPYTIYGFKCRFNLYLIYSSISVALFVIGIALIFSKWFMSKRIVRTGIFVVNGLYGIIPIMHFFTIYGMHNCINFLMAMGFLYLGGCALYAFRIPEIFYPGRFDYCFNSHQIWHLAVIAAAVVHYFGVIDFYHWSAKNFCSFAVIK